MTRLIMLISDTVYSKLFQRHSAAAGGEAAASACRKGLKFFFRCFFISVNFPETAAFIVPALVENESFHVLHRIAEKESDFMRKLILRREAFHQLNQTGVHWILNFRQNAVAAAGQDISRFHRR